MIHTDYGCEINAVRHCTNACAACNHASTRYTDEYFMDPAVLKDDLDIMKQHLRTKLLFVQGGEPLLHPKVTELVRLCWESKIASQCGVLTNGKLLRQMGDEFWELLTAGKMELRLSVYPDLDKSLQPWLEEKSQKWGFFFRWQEINAFKAVFASVPDGRSYYGCPWNRCLTIHEGYFYICPLSAFWPATYMKRAEKWKDIDPHIDGIPIQGMTDEKLQEFLNRKHPLESCKICSGTHGANVEWHQNKSLEEWEKVAGVAESLV